MKGPKLLSALIATAAMIFSALAVSVPSGIVHAQSAGGAQAIITWQVVGGSAPSSYKGKVLPVQGAPLKAAVAVLQNGKFVPLGSQTIYWYLDQNFIGGGLGAQTITFNAPGHNEYMGLQVEIPNYQGGISNTIYVAMVNPQAVIVAPYPGNTFSASSVSVQAVPYFFNAADLSKLVFSWAVNGNAVSTAENPQSLTVNLSKGASAGYSLAITLGVQVSGNPFLTAGQNLILTAAGQ